MNQTFTLYDLAGMIVQSRFTTVRDQDVEFLLKKFSETFIIKECNRLGCKFTKTGDDQYIVDYYTEKPPCFNKTKEFSGYLNYSD